MEWLLLMAFLVFIGGLTIVTVDALKHADKPSHNKPVKPTR